MASKGPLPPVYNPERRFDLFEIELELWAAATTIDKDKQGINGMLLHIKFLTESHSNRMRPSLILHVQFC